MIMTYIDLDYMPSESDTICRYFLKPSKGISFSKAAESIAAESSIGTWTEVCTANKKIKKIGAKVFCLEKRKGIAKIAYPEELFEKGNLPQILSSIAGNIFGMRVVENLRLLDIEFPKRLVEEFPGPEVGVDEIRKMAGVKNRPLTGTIYKPKVGLTPKQMAELAYIIYSAGIDYSKDDENLGSMQFNKFEERIKRMMEVIDRLKSEGKKVIYAPNISAPVETMLERAKFVKKQGGKCIMIDIITVGWSGLQYIRKQNLGMIIHAHRAGHAAFTRNPFHGISMICIAKCARLAGVSALHTGTVVGKMEGSREEVIEINNFLRSEWNGKKKVMPIASGGLHPGFVPKLVEILGKDLIINFGGGLWGHPRGPEAGAKAIRQSIEAVMQGIDLKEYAKTHKELSEAINIWKPI